MAAPVENAHTCIGLIPARSGSKRIPDKNIRPLAGHPLLAYTVRAALDSGVFKKVLVSTDSGRYANIAQHYGADVLYRPPEMASDTSPDVEWVRHALSKAGEYGCFAILRPTSPFRLPQTIRRAWAAFQEQGLACDSLRAVEKAGQHPAKMWVIRNGYLHNIMPFGPEEQPWHSSQMPTLPEMWVQNASLEIAWTDVVERTGTIAGERIIPFRTFEDEGFDLNTLDDWEIAEARVRRGEAKLPEVTVPAYAEVSA